MKGYNYLAMKSNNVKKQVEQLHPPIWQTNHIPDNGYIHEGFARVLV